MQPTTNLSTDELGCPLNQAELAELAAFLKSDVVSAGCLALEGLDGFICAIVVGPELIKPSEWLP